MEAFGKWLVEEMLGPVIVGFVGLIVGTFWRLMHKISAGDSKLHARIDQIKDNYVKNDRLNEVKEDIDRRLDEIKADGHARSKDLKEYIRAELNRQK